MDRREKAEAYLRYWEKKLEEREPLEDDREASNEIDRLVATEPFEAWELICHLVEVASTNELLAIVAAGPLEDLLKQHGSEVIAHAEEVCQRSDRMRLALSGVWGINPGNPIFERWYALMWKYGFAEGKREAL
jgi:Family of unknown function (DUF6869)